MSEPSGRLDEQQGTSNQAHEAVSDTDKVPAPSGGTRSSRPASLVARTITGAVYALVVLGCLFLGPVWTAVAVSLMAFFACQEFYRMVRMMGRMPNELLGLIAALLLPFLVLLNSPLFVLVGAMCLVVAVAIWYIATPRASLSDVMATFFGPIYISLMLSSIVIIRCADSGLPGALLAVGVVLSVWANDTAAYFVGSRFGSHKLAPTISPKKSVEGLWGGLVGGLVPWLLLAILHTCSMSFAVALPTGLAASVAAVLGDLFESRIKRGVGVKDSGTILPGHGGMLDRSDSLLFASAVACMGLLIGGIL